MILFYHYHISLDDPNDQIKKSALNRHGYRGLDIPSLLFEVVSSLRNTSFNGLINNNKINSALKPMKHIVCNSVSLLIFLFFHIRV